LVHFDDEGFRDMADDSVTKQKARGNRLTSPADEAIRFLVRLAYTDLGPLRPGDLLNLIDGLRAHFAFARSAEVELKQAEKNSKVLRPVIGVVRRLIEAFANGEQISLPFGPGEMRIDASGPTVSFSIKTQLGDHVLLGAWALIGEDEAMRIKRCPECHTVFYGQLGQVFCTHRCANNRAARNYRQKHPEERRQKARLAYEAKQKKALGGKVKVGRRPKRPTDSFHTPEVRRKGK
jgi:hypothetical protein